MVTRRTMRWRGFLALRYASQAVVWLPTKAAKDVANVVIRGDALGEHAVPAADDAAHNLDAGVVCVTDRDFKAVLVLFCEMLIIGSSWWRAVKVGSWEPAS